LSIIAVKQRAEYKTKINTADKLCSYCAVPMSGLVSPAV